LKRNERNTKENTLKILTYNTQQTQILQVQIRKLNDEKKNIQYQSKIQTQKYNKNLKESLSKINMLKKSDAKKSQLLNTLKYEIDRKER
jgi:hypothetical protein